MEPSVYTHARWRVKPGHEAAFIEAWSALSDVFSALAHPPLWGTLLRSAAEPNVFYSFGPWPSADAVEAMRADTQSQAALRALCEEAAPGLYHVVRHVEPALRQRPGCAGTAGPWRGLGAWFFGLGTWVFAALACHGEGAEGGEAIYGREASLSSASLR